MTRPGYKLRARRGSSAAERIAANTRLTSSGCLEWILSGDGNGYGKLQVGRTKVKAHRVAYEVAHGAVPDGMVIDHLCRNRLCCNPDHLEAVTHAENVRRGSRKAKTHCPRGHEYSDDNTRVDRKGSRSCLSCKRESSAARRREAKRAGGRP